MKRNRLLKRLALVVLGVFSISLSAIAGNKPSGLMTDLIEHTDRTWNNGYVSSLPVWKLDSAIESLQYAAIRSMYPAFSWIVPGEAQNTHQIA